MKKTKEVKEEKEEKEEKNVDKNISGFTELFTKIKGYNSDVIEFVSINKLMGGDSMVVFIEDGKLKRFPIYRTTYNFGLWKKHFEIYFETGHFPTEFFMIPYSSHPIPDEINFPTGFPFGVSKYNESFYTYTPEFSEYVNTLRAKYPHLGLGFKSVSHP